MKIAVACSTESEPEVAVAEAYETLLSRLQADPDFLLLACTVELELREVVATLRTLAPGVPVHGGTSCLGVLTGEGFQGKGGVALGLLGISDPDGSYGVGVSRIEGNGEAAGAAAVKAALESAGRSGEVPALAFITAAPGCEEGILRGVQQVLGRHVPLFGGSSADNDVSGRWRQSTQEQTYSDAVVITAFFPSTEISYAFHSGYSPTSHQGRITECDGRRVMRIDGQPAAEVYDRWTEGKVLPRAAPANVLAQTTLHPLGRVIGEVGGAPYLLLSHPEQVHEDGSLSLFAEATPGEELVLMEGTVESLVTRAGRVAVAALEANEWDSADIAGGLMVFCAGCMLSVQSQLERVAADVGAGLGDKPFLSMFTFGEQGCFPGGENRHGNLMISVLVFAA